MAVSNKGGALSLDGDGHPIQDGAYTLFQDGTATPQISPLAITTALKTIAIPSNAVKAFFRVRGCAMRFGAGANLDATADDGYALLADGESIEVPCSKGNTVYFKADTGTGNVDFFFTCI